jgi:large subunit ribosomal protein L4
MTSSPLWRGGGRTFPNRPDENFSHKVNRKMFRAGLSSILSQLAREERLVVVENFTLDSPKTKPFAQKLKGMGLDNVLIITDVIDDNLHLSSRNLPHVRIITAANTDPLSLMRHDKVIVTRSAVAKIEELFA